MASSLCTSHMNNLANSHAVFSRSERDDVCQASSAEGLAWKNAYRAAGDEGHGETGHEGSQGQQGVAYFLPSKVSTVAKMWIRL